MVKRKHPGRTAAAVILLLCLFLLVSCKKADSGDTGIEILIEETVSQDGTQVQIPVFHTENEKLQQSLRDLEKETRKLQKVYERAQKRGEHLEMRCYLCDTDHYPQVTVVWYTDGADTRLYNLVTLAVDEKEGLPVTCKEALERTGMSGVDLSLRVGKLAQEKKLRGEISTMEMQGFKLDEEGGVSEVYMKLEMGIKGEEETKTEEHFFSYDPKEESLVKLSEKGFDVP